MYEVCRISAAVIFECGEACGSIEGVVAFWFCVGFSGTGRDERSGAEYAFEHGSSCQVQSAAREPDAQDDE